MKPKFIVRETQDGGFAVFRFNAQNGSFDQFSPKTGSVSKEDAEKECVECNYLAEEETPGLINTDKKTKNNKRTARKKLSFFIILAILVVVPTVFFFE